MCTYVLKIKKEKTWCRIISILDGAILYVDKVIFNSVVKIHLYMIYNYMKIVLNSSHILNIICISRNFLKLIKTNQLMTLVLIGNDCGENECNGNDHFNFVYIYIMIRQSYGEKNAFADAFSAGISSFKIAPRQRVDIFYCGRVKVLRYPIWL